METIKKSVDLAQSAQTVWTLVGNPAALAEWHPAIASSPVQGKQRSCTLADGAQILEEVEAHDDAAMSYRYRIVESPLPIKDYVSTLQVESLGEGRARLSWSATYTPLAPPADVAAMLGGVYDAGLSAVSARF